MSPDAFKTIAEGIGTLITTLAVLVAGLWVLLRYALQREDFPRIEFFVDVEFVGMHHGEWVIEILGLLKNVGTVPHKIKRLDFKVRALYESDPIRDGGEHIRHQLEFSDPLRQAPWTPNNTKKPMVLMPGVNLRYSYQFHIPASAVFLLIEGELDYQDDSRLEHRADKVVRVPRQSESTLGHHAPQNSVPDQPSPIHPPT